MNLRIPAVLFLSACGIAAMYTLFPIHKDTAGVSHVRLSRDEAISAAQHLAANYGTDISSWPASVSTHIDDGQTLALRQLPGKAAIQSFPALDIRVIAESPDSKDVILVRLTPAGQPLSYVIRRSAPAHIVNDIPFPGLAEHELERYAGALAPKFARTAANVKTQDGLRSAWEWSDPTTPGVQLRFEATTSHGHIVRASYDCSVSPRLLGSARRQRQSVDSILSAIFIACGAAIACLAAWTFFSYLTRRSDHLRFGLAACPLAAVPVIVGFIGGGISSRLAFVPLGAGAAVDFRILTAVLVAALMLLAVFVVIAAGYAVLPASERTRWIELRLLTQGHVFARPVGLAVLLGIAGGSALACLPFLVAALPAFRGLDVSVLDPWFITAPRPFLEALNGFLLGIEGFTIFGFFLPWTLRTFRNPAVSWGIFVIVGSAFIASVRAPFPMAVAPNLLCGALLLGGYLLLYWTGGVLSAWIAPVGFFAAVHAATFFTAGTSAFTQSGWHITDVQCALAAGGALLWLLGTKADSKEVLKSMEPGESALSHSDRERLRAEFSVARRAQEGMLPSAVPVLKGYTIAASCEPAREVGGDLYDFLDFPGGLWGFCVADVSGKGVPASLYMTLTKGMLGSARLRPPDLPFIATRMNRHLADTGKHRTFVTMSLGLLDGPARRFQHVRAGHNPPALFRAKSKTCEFLQPRGIGLGITASSTFEQNLEVQEIQLSDGDSIVLYSDGLTECMNEHKEQFGEERLVDVITRNAHLNALGIQDAIIRAARDFRGAAEPHDDLTVVVLRAEEFHYDNPQGEKNSSGF